MNTLNKPNTRAFRATMGALLFLTFVVFAADSLVGSGIVNKSGVSLTSHNLAGISSMLQNIVPSIAIGVSTLLIAMLVIGKLLGQNWRQNVKAIVDKNNNDSTFALAEKIAIATVFVAMSVPSATWFVWLAVFAAKLVVMLTVSIVITTALSMLIMSVVKDPAYRWYQVDSWWINMMNAAGNDMVARLTGSVFFTVGMTIFGVLLMAQL